MDGSAGQRIARRSREQIARIRGAGAVVHEVLQALEAAAVPGVSTGELDELARRLTLDRGARPAFLGYCGYPASLCISVNEEVIHGIPSPDRRLAEGDLVGLDFGAVLAGWYADSARTVMVGLGTPEAARLRDATRRALAAGIAMVRPGAAVGDIGAAVQGSAEAAGYSVVREFVGHGIGRRLHEPPHIPNYGPGGRGPILEEGMVIAIEPMVNAGGRGVRMLPDGWTAVTLDGSLSAHFEHTLAVTENGPEILTLPEGVPFAM